VKNIQEENLVDEPHEIPIGQSLVCSVGNVDLIVSGAVDSRELKSSSEDYRATFTRLGISSV